MYHPDGAGSPGNHMALEWAYSSENVDWEELHRLYMAVHMGQECAADLRAVFSKSMLSCFAFDSGRLIAAGRALQAREGGSYICGVAVEPDHQGLGIGRELVIRLVLRSRGQRRIYLHAAPGKESFYRRLGFKRTGTTMAMDQAQLHALVDGLRGDELGKIPNAVAPPLP
jgi:ribosomal protein S18 acetylase RimI-like enzyme